MKLLSLNYLKSKDTCNNTESVELTFSSGSTTAFHASISFWAYFKIIHHHVNLMIKMDKEINFYEAYNLSILYNY